MEDINPQRFETTNSPDQKKPNFYKILFFILIGFLIIAAIGIVIYFFIKSNKDTKIEDSSSESEEIKSIEADTLEYEIFEDNSGSFSFKYPSQIIRLNTEDIESTISQESKEKFSSSIVFIGVLQDGSSVVQITAETLEFDKSKSFSDSYDELLELNNNSGTEININNRELGENSMDLTLESSINGVNYKTIEKLIIYGSNNYKNNIVALSVTISENIFEKYQLVGEYVINSINLGETITIENNSEDNVVRNFYLGSYPLGDGSPHDGSGIIENEKFDKSSDMLCFVTDLVHGASGFSIEIFDSGGNLIISEYDISLDSGLSSTCNEISFGIGNYVLKLKLSGGLIESIPFEVN